jgi:predicted glutamine amidotransferase
MPQNPLQKFFRQPKIFISLPSKGVYNVPGSIQGDINNLPVYGMTGMDEIIMKTPDAMMTGEATARVIESCCPAIKDASQISNIDTDIILAAIRIATWGTHMAVTHNCPMCEHENHYDVDLTKIIDHFSSATFNTTVVLQQLTVKLQPLSFKQVAEFALKNYAMQKTLQQVSSIEDDQERQKVLEDLYNQLATVRNEVFALGIESIQADGQVVTQRDFIDEWLKNSEKDTFDAIKQVIESNNNAWRTPNIPVQCENCQAENTIRVEMDQSTFFGSA